MMRRDTLQKITFCIACIFFLGTLIAFFMLGELIGFPSGRDTNIYYSDTTGMGDYEEQDSVITAFGYYMFFIAFILTITLYKLIGKKYFSEKFTTTEKKETKFAIIGLSLFVVIATPIEFILIYILGQEQMYTWVYFLHISIGGLLYWKLPSYLDSQFKDNKN